MKIQSHHLLAAALTAALLGLPAVARAQVSAMPNLSGGQPVSQTVGALQKSAVVGASRALANPGVNVRGPGYVAPAPGYAAPYYGPYSGDYSLGNTLQGASSVINAQGQFNIQNQQAKLEQQKVEQEKITTKRAKFDEYLYEKANTPTVNDIREKQMQEDLRRQRNDPPKSEIWSGVALNGLLATVQKEQAAIGSQGPPIRIDPALTKQINVSSGVSGAGIGALQKDELQWPLPLTRPAFNADRKKIDDLATQLVKEASGGKINPKTLDQTGQAVTALKGKVKEQIDEMSPSENVKSNRFCNELKDALRSLEDPAAVNYFNGKFSVQAASVPELVDQMTMKGLTFAPATAGSESAYNSLYQALASYDMALNQMTAQLQSPGRPPAQR